MVRAFFGKLYVPNSQEGLCSGSPYLSLNAVKNAIMFRLLSNKFNFSKTRRVSLVFHYVAVTVTIVIVIITVTIMDCLLCAKPYIFYHKWRGDILVIFKF